MLDATQLLGSWQRQPGEDRSLPYPDRIEFQKGGIYNAPLRNDVAQLWHSGDWELTERGIRIQCANDAMREYAATLDQFGNLIITDEAGKRIEYRKN